MHGETSDIDMAFLRQACSSLWESIGIGGVEKNPGKKNSLRANHVHVECGTPFLIAATSLDAPSGEEHFGVALITSRLLIDEFLEGPYPPHNRPRVLQLEQVVGSQIEAFMKGPKEISLLRKTVKFVTDLTTLVPIVHGLVITGQSVKLRICADDEIPMGLQLSWDIAEQRG